LIVVGVTGKYCSGKDTATDILSEHGFVEINVDKLGHQALEECRVAVVERFGESIVGHDGRISRSALGRIVFSDRSALRDLEAILHPVMVAMVEERIAELRSEDLPGIVVNAAILFRMGLHLLCDAVIYLHASFLVRVRRARRRDRSGLFAVLRRLAAQRDVAPQFSAPDADILRVGNDGSREQLRVRLRTLLSLP